MSKQHTTESEIWRPIPGALGRYEASNLGRIKSNFGNGRIIKPGAQKSRHLFFQMNFSGKQKTIRVHRAVLLAFVGDPPDGCESCHFDGNPINNRLDNLRWDTRKANVADQLRHGVRHRGSRSGRSKLKEVDIPIIRERRRNGETLASIANDFKVCISAVSSICHRKVWGWLV